MSGENVPTVGTLEHLEARRDSAARTLVALQCQRRSGETRKALEKRDADIARVEQMLDQLDVELEAHRLLNKIKSNELVTVTATHYTAFRDLERAVRAELTDRCVSRQVVAALEALDALR